jgi:peptidoglycan biosynthesis protein MviN/MurJ (putative lipid II flippase)
LSWALLFIFIDNPLTLIAINHEKFKKYLTYFSFIILGNILLNIFFGINFGPLGIASSFLIAGIANVMALFYFLNKFLNIRINLSKIFKGPVLIMILFSLFILFLKLFNLHFILIIILGAIFYLTLLLITKDFIFIFFKKNFELKKWSKNNNS